MNGNTLLTIVCGAGLWGSILVLGYINGNEIREAKMEKNLSFIVMPKSLEVNSDSLPFNPNGLYVSQDSLALKPRLYYEPYRTLF